MSVFQQIEKMETKHKYAFRDKSSAVTAVAVVAGFGILAFFAYEAVKGLSGALGNLKLPNLSFTLPAIRLPNFGNSGTTNNAIVSSNGNVSVNQKQVNLVNTGTTNPFGITGYAMVGKLRLPTYAPVPPTSAMVTPPTVPELTLALSNYTPATIAGLSSQISPYALTNNAILAGKNVKPEFATKGIAFTGQDVGFGATSQKYLLFTKSQQG